MTVICRVISEWMRKAVRFIPLSPYFSETKVEDYGSSVAHIFNFEVF